ncbi:MAG: DUF1592 domain-containing protein [Bryobacter sp.]|nr:DUF1592 domain-containing protein [Bryobacter sp.]
MSLSWGQDTAALEPAFAAKVKPFLVKNCQACHNADNATAGVRVDQLNAALEDAHLRHWEGIAHRVKAGTMPPKGLPQPKPEERAEIVEWVEKALEVARLRPTPRNGSVRRLTVAQYRNTLKDLLKLDDDLTEILPPDAVSKDGFLNNQETQQLSPLLLEAYLEIAEEALKRAIVDPAKKPVVQNFRMDLGRGVNPNPVKEELVLGANSMLLDNPDFLVTELAPKKPFAYEPFRMQTKFRFIEGYQGNDTVRGWRDFDSIYHNVFACVRGSRGYPKGHPYTTVPQGLLLRPAIPNDELFTEDGTYGPKANFKISLRELPKEGRFRVTVTAAKYNDGLLLDKGAASQTPARPGSLVAKQPLKTQSVVVPRAGVYQVDVYKTEPDRTPPAPDATRLEEGLGGSWNFEQGLDGSTEGNARAVPSEFGKSLLLESRADSLTVARRPEMNVGTGDFTLAAWVNPSELRKAAILAMGAPNYTQGWIFEMPAGNGVLRLETTGEHDANGAVATPPGVLKAKAWQHVAAVVKRGTNLTRLYVNGFLVAEGTVRDGNLDNPKMPLRLGHLPGGSAFVGQMDEVKIYRRALSEAELQALVEPGRKFAVPPPEKTQDVYLTLGDREFSGPLAQAAFVAVRLPAGPLKVEAKYGGVHGLDKVVLTPLPVASDTAKRFLAFEKRAPKLGVHMGFRRDCGSTFAPVGEVKAVGTPTFQKYVFEGAVRNYPTPDVEENNVNYLAGFREIAVRSEYTDGRDMPRLVIKSVEFEGPFYEAWPPPSHTNIFTDFAKKDDEAAYARHILGRFATRAYRRPASEAEVSTLLRVYERARKEGADFPASVKEALEVALTSPQFLFLVEQSQTPKPEPLTEHELASKLSYFLWNAPPDARLLRLAEQGMLRKTLSTETARLMGDRRFNAFLKEFGEQWLTLDKFQVVEVDRKRYPELTRDAKANLKREPVEYLRYLFLQNLPVKNLVASDFVVANEAVATYYGLGDKVESGFDFVAIPHGRKDVGGVLTQPAILSGLSDGRESNPIKRGAWLARKIIAEPPSDPPPNVPALKEEETDLTLRQRLEQHRNQTGCMQCHMKIDPWGIALEEYDAGGKWKTKPVDASSTLPDKTEVKGMADLQRYLSGERIDQVAFSVLKHLATYANGRSLTFYEQNRLKKEALALKTGGYKMQDLLRYVVTSELFTEK